MGWQTGQSGRLGKPHRRSQTGHGTHIVGFVVPRLGRHSRPSSRLRQGVHYLGKAVVVGNDLIDPVAASCSSQVSSSMSDVGR